VFVCVIIFVENGDLFVYEVVFDFYLEIGYVHVVGLIGLLGVGKLMFVLLFVCFVW